MPESQAVRTVVSTDPARADASASRSVVRRSCECGQRGGACACRDEEKSAGHGTLQRSARTSPGAPVGGYGPALPLVRAALASPSQPLDPDTRRELGSRLGCDFSPVRVHTSPAAAESARALHASAYTVGPERGLRLGTVLAQERGGAGPDRPRTGSRRAATTGSRLRVARRGNCRGRIRRSPGAAGRPGRGRPGHPARRCRGGVTIGTRPGHPAKSGRPSCPRCAPGPAPAHRRRRTADRGRPRCARQSSWSSCTTS